VKLAICRRNALRPFVIAVLLVTWTCRALVPLGFMPGPGGLMLCPSYGPVAGAHGFAPNPSGSRSVSPVPGTHSSGNTVSGADMPGMDMPGMDMSGMDRGRPAQGHGHGGGHSGHDRAGTCPFAALASQMAMQRGLDWPLLPPTAATHPSVRFEEFVPTGRLVPSPLPRGPPALS